jgi:hypothetical protein
MQTLLQDVRFLQWKSAEESAKSLLTTRATIVDRLSYYQRVLGLPADPAADAVKLDDRELTEANFDDAFAALVRQYERPVALQKLPQLKLSGGTSPSQQSGASGQGRLYLNVNENAELNIHLPGARDDRLAANVVNTVSTVLTFIPDFDIDLHFWGLGGSSQIFGGKKLSDAGRVAAEIIQTLASWEQDQAGMAGRTAGHERRADDWLFQYNQAAHELMQMGRQILTSLVGAQIARHEYQTVQRQIENSTEVDQFLHDKFTNEELHLWMQGEIARLYYEYYRLAFDTARKAERTMKQELMRPELDAQDFVKFNYWDGGRKGLLSGEALQLDLQRLELAYHEHNKRELELTRHVSLRQLNPLALHALRATGTCQFAIPEWLYDRDCPGHYMRRLKSVAVSIPSVTGPYTPVNCTVTLLKSSVRKTPILKDGEYARQGSEDDRFADFAGAVQSIVTSSGSNDSGLFETNLRDERFLPFEGAGAVSQWKLDLPKDYPAFDYATIADVVLHVRYTARQGVDATKVKTALVDLFAETSAATGANFALFLSLPRDFPTEWAAFVNGTADFSATIRRDFFPYFTHGKAVTITQLELYGGSVAKHHASGDVDAATGGLADDDQFVLTAPPDAAGPMQVLTRTASAQVFLLVRYALE